MSKQEHTSEKTSRKQVTALHKKLVQKFYVEAGDRVLDYGGGKWDLGVEYFAKNDCYFQGVRSLQSITPGELRSLQVGRQWCGPHPARQCAQRYQRS